MNKNNNFPVKILLIIPAYNEENNIIDVVQSVQNERLSIDILVINDASTDATAKLVGELGFVKLLDLPFNLGIGGAVQTGFKYALKNAYDMALQFDGDGQHNSFEINKLVKPLLAKQADVVIGSRFLQASQGYRSTAIRRLGIHIFKWASHLLIGRAITDCTSGFRAYNQAAIRFLANNYPVDYPEPEAVILLGKNNFQIMEVAVEMEKRQSGNSSISTARGIYYMIKVLLSMFMTASRSKITRK